MELHQPKCCCLQCSDYSLIYNSVFDIHRCLECELEINAKHVNNLISAFGVHTKGSIIVQNFNSLCCLSCLITGSIYFKDEIISLVYCDLCKRRFTIDSLHQLMATAYKTKLIEESYSYSFMMGKI